MVRRRAVSSLTLLACLLAAPIHAQEPALPRAEEMIDLFFDCQTGGCRDMDFLRRPEPGAHGRHERRRLRL